MMGPDEVVVVVCVYVFVCVLLISSGGKRCSN